MLKMNEKIQEIKVLMKTRRMLEAFKHLEELGKEIEEMNDKIETYQKTISSQSGSKKNGS